MKALLPDRQRLIRITCLVVLLGAILPSVVYLGHDSMAGAEDLSQPDVAAAHAAHCHVAAAKCSGQANLVGTWSISEEPVRIAVDGFLYAVPHAGAAVALAASVPPTDPPPRPA